MVIRAFQRIDKSLPLNASYCYDSESGLCYLSARSYDPVTRQFLSKDLTRNDGEQSSYQYCGGNPVCRVDPSGNVDINTYLNEWFDGDFYGAYNEWYYWEFDAPREPGMSKKRLNAGRAAAAQRSTADLARGRAKAEAKARAEALANAFAGILHLFTGDSTIMQGRVVYLPQEHGNPSAPQDEEFRAYTDPPAGQYQAEIKLDNLFHDECYSTVSWTYPGGCKDAVDVHVSATRANNGGKGEWESEGSNEPGVVGRLHGEWETETYLYTHRRDLSALVQISGDCVVLREGIFLDDFYIDPGHPLE